MKHSMHGEDELLRRVMTVPTPWPASRPSRRPKRPATAGARWPLVILGGALVVFVISVTYYLYVP